MTIVLHGDVRNHLRSSITEVAVCAWQQFTTHSTFPAHCIKGIDYSKSSYATAIARHEVSKALPLFQTPLRFPKHDSKMTLEIDGIVRSKEELKKNHKPFCKPCSSAKDVGGENSVLSLKPATSLTINI